jgi:G:T/U-mismatch repair DNA glycosylase
MKGLRNVYFLKLDFLFKQWKLLFLILSDISTCQKTLFPSFKDKFWTVLKLISWKHSFESLAEEFEMTKKKKEALDNLLDAGKISQSTYDSFNEKIDEAVAEIERRQRALLEKMNSKVGELEDHTKTLEMLLANFEIKHVTGEIDEEVYQREINLLSTGLEVARQELGTAKEAISQLSSSLPIPPTDIVVPQEVELQTTEGVEAPEPEIASAEETVLVAESEETPEENVEQNLPEPPVESVEGGNVEILQSQEEPGETSQETWQNTEETQETEQSTEEEMQSTETVAEGEETQE